MNCSICLDEYDQKERRPRIFWRCGHTFCQQCILALQKAAQITLTIACPTCKVEHNITAQTPVNNTILPIFPQNFELSSIIEKIDEDFKKSIEFCSVHPTNNKLFCFDKNCTGIKYFCKTCLPSIHKNCNIEFQFTVKQFDTHVLIRQLNTNKLEKIKSSEILIDDMINCFKKKVPEQLSSFLENWKTYVVDRKKINQIHKEFDPYLLGPKKRSEGRQETILSGYNDNLLESTLLDVLNEQEKLMQVIDSGFTTFAKKLSSIIDQLSRSREVMLAIKQHNLQKYSDFRVSNQLVKRSEILQFDNL
jgi:hypothetical protein